MDFLGVDLDSVRKIERGLRVLGEQGRLGVVGHILSRKSKCPAPVSCRHLTTPLREEGGGSRDGTSRQKRSRCTEFIWTTDHTVQCGGRREPGVRDVRQPYLVREEKGERVFLSSGSPCFRGQESDAEADAQEDVAGYPCDRRSKRSVIGHGVASLRVRVKCCPATARGHGHAFAMRTGTGGLDQSAPGPPRSWCQRPSVGRMSRSRKSMTACENASF